MFKGPIKYFIAFIFIVFLGVMALFFFEIQAINNTRVNHLQLDQVQDGTYVGEASSILIHVKVSVEVENHEIKNIELLEYAHNRGEEATRVLDYIVNQNTTRVDNVSSATTSSIMMKAAVADALSQGVNQ